MTEKSLNKKYKIKWEPFELLMCPYCGARLNRVGNKNILPTSCIECNADRFEPKVMSVAAVVKK